jgi:hypothetical protein
MNYFVIILGIIVVFLIFYVYTIVTAVPVIVKSVDLTQPVANIPPSSITNPYSVNYSVAVWVYVDQFTPEIGRFLMFGDAAHNGANSLFSLRMDTRGNNLYADVLVNQIISYNNSIHIIIISYDKNISFTNSIFNLNVIILINLFNNYE